MSLRSVLCAAALLTIASLPASADIVRVNESAFTPSAGTITFSEFAIGTTNPVYTPSMYGGGAGAPTVTFGGYFVGQSLGTTNPGACPGGAVTTGCVLGNPTGPLALDPKSPATRITTDGAMPTSPILSGTPTFNGPISIEFSTLQSGVGLIGGYFDNVGSTGITAFGIDGSVLGTVSNT